MHVVIELGGNRHARILLDGQLLKNVYGLKLETSVREWPPKLILTLLPDKVTVTAGNAHVRKKSRKG